MMEDTRIEEVKNEEVRAEKPKAEKKKYSLKIQKIIATLMITVGMAVVAFCGVRLLTLALNTDARNIDMDDWLQDKEYRDSDTLAWHMVNDIGDVIEYMDLRSILEENGTLNLDRPALVVQREDGTIITYTMEELVSEGRNYGIYVFEDIMDEEDYDYFHSDTEAAQARYEQNVRVRVLWSLMNREDATVDLGSNVWEERQKRIDEAIAQAQKEDVTEILKAGRIPMEAELDQMSLRELIRLCENLPKLVTGESSISPEIIQIWYNHCEGLEQREAEILSRILGAGEEQGQETETTSKETEEASASVAETVESVTVNVERYEDQELELIYQEQDKLRQEIYERLENRRASQNLSWGYLQNSLEEFLYFYLQRYYQLCHELKQAGNLSYTIYLSQGNTVVTYQDSHTAQHGQFLHSVDTWDMSYTYDCVSHRIQSDMPDDARVFPAQWTQSWFERGDYDTMSIHFGIDVDDLGTYADTYQQEAITYQTSRSQFLSSVKTAAISVLLVFIGMIWMIPLCGRRDGDGTIHLNLYDRIPTEFGFAGIVLLGVGVYAVMLLATEGLPELWRGDMAADVQQWILGGIAVALLILAYLMLWWGLYGLIRRLKAHSFLKNSVCAILIRWCMKPFRWCIRILRGWGCKVRTTWNTFMENKDVTWKTAVLFLVYALINTMLCVHGAKTFYFGYGEMALLLMLVLNVFVGACLIRKAIQRKRIRQGVTKIAGGKLDHKLLLEELTGEEKNLAREINQIGGGLQHAVEESLKNERMKTELITNVSHDIKTPLTSIINYVDLLKREHIQDPKIQGYIQVLDQKSQRLKTLTEDLVEASKASSGTLQVSREKIDFVELINQTTGEFSDRFADAQLKLVTNIQETPAYILADGRHVWRILENLYRNAEKYSMPGTRVYVEVFEKIGRVFFVMKNVSNAPLNIKAEELTERFIRGDVSRTTEGSGLGLSIAKDMTELMDGTFRVYLDGDLFRVTVSFAVIHEEKPDLKEMEESIRRRVADEEKNVQVETADVVGESGFAKNVPVTAKNGVEGKDPVEKTKKDWKLVLPKISLLRKKKEDFDEE